MKCIVLLLLLTEHQQMFTLQASIRASPGVSQFFEYDEVSLSCEPEEWTVWTYKVDRSDLSPCGSGWGVVLLSVCKLSLKPYHSGQFWCQSGFGESSPSINITVTVGTLLLQSPVVPVAPGQNVTLSCRDRMGTVESLFYKNKSLIRTDPSHHIILHNFSRLDQNLYSCQASGLDPSASSWVLIEGDSAPAVLSAQPDSSHLLEYDNLMLSCRLTGLTGLTEPSGSVIRGSCARWTVVRFTLWPTRRVSSCGDRWGQSTTFGCSLSPVKQQDSALYWCECGNSRSNTVNITVHDSDIVLLLPLLPPAEGTDVPLRCRARMSFTSATFFKDGRSIGTTSGNMTLSRVSISDQGEYACSVKGQRSEPSLLSVRALSAPPTNSWWCVWTLVRFLVVSCPYLLCSGVLWSLCRHGAAGHLQYDVINDNMDEVTTEHSF